MPRSSGFEYLVSNPEEVSPEASRLLDEANTIAFLLERAERKVLELDGKIRALEADQRLYGRTPLRADLIAQANFQKEEAERKSRKLSDDWKSAEAELQLTANQIQEQEARFRHFFLDSALTLLSSDVYEYCWRVTGEQANLDERRRLREERTRAVAAAQQKRKQLRKQRREIESRISALHDKERRFGDLIRRMAEVLRAAPDEKGPRKMAMRLGEDHRSFLKEREDLQIRHADLVSKIRKTHIRGFEARTQAGRGYLFQIWIEVARSRVSIEDLGTLSAEAQRRCLSNEKGPELKDLPGYGRHIRPRLQADRISGRDSEAIGLGAVSPA